MTWNDDIDEYEDRFGGDEDPCDHEDHDTDILDGRCHCWRCGETWYATAAQIDAQLRFESDYYEMMEREERWRWWRDLWDRIRSFFPRRRGPTFSSDDDIPF